MNIAPRYNLPIGSELTLMQRPVVVTGQDENGYEVVGREDGVANLVPFGRLIEQLKLPGAAIDTALPSTGGRQRQRLGGHATEHSLKEDQQETARFRYAVCEAVRIHCAMHALQIGKPSFEPSERYLDRRKVRKAIATIAKPIFGKEIHVNPPQGGKSKALWGLYRGRTLKRHYLAYMGLEPGESALATLATRDHLKGNRTQRICHVLRRMMTETLEEVGLDLRGPKTGTVWTCRGIVPPL